MPLEVPPICAAALAALCIALSLRLIRPRRGNRISLGDAGDRAPLSRIRTHGTFAEYARFGLLLLALAERAGGGGALAASDRILPDHRPLCPCREPVLSAASLRLAGARQGADLRGPRAGGGSGAAGLTASPTGPKAITRLP